MTNHPRRRTLTRRAALQGATAFASLALLPPLAHAQSGQAAAAAKPAAKGTRLVLLGTRGGPGVTPDRSQTASALLVDGVPYLLDCGYGTLRALVQSGMTRDDAYRVVQENAMRAWDEHTDFRARLEADPRVTVPAAALDEAFDLTRSLRNIGPTFDALDAID